jgi:hypothetical protein
LGERDEDTLGDFLGGADIAHLTKGRGKNQAQMLAHERGKGRFAPPGIEFGNQQMIGF